MKKFIAPLIMLILLTCNAWAQKTETRNVSDFTRVAVGGGYDVYLMQGDKEQVRLEGSEEAIAKVETIVDRNTLKIKKKKGQGRDWNKNGKLKIYVTFKSLEAITSSGSSDIVVKSKIISNSFSLVTSGSSDVEMSLEVDVLKLVLSGSSDVKISGMAKTQSVTVSGSGEVDAKNLESEVASVRISGSGSVSIYAKESLEATVSGSGDIHYRGDPKQKIKISGSGSMHSID